VKSHTTEKTKPIIYGTPQHLQIVQPENNKTNYKTKYRNGNRKIKQQKQRYNSQQIKVKRRNNNFQHLLTPVEFSLTKKEAQSNKYTQPKKPHTGKLLQEVTTILKNHTRTPHIQKSYFVQSNMINKKSQTTEPYKIQINSIKTAKVCDKSNNNKNASFENNLSKKPVNKVFNNLQTAKQRLSENIFYDKHPQRTVGETRTLQVSHVSTSFNIKKHPHQKTHQNLREKTDVPKANVTRVTTQHSPKNTYRNTVKQNREEQIQHKTNDHKQVIGNKVEEQPTTVIELLKLILILLTSKQTIDITTIKTEKLIQQLENFQNEKQGNTKT